MKTTAKQAAMREVFEAWKSSGLSLRAFGEREGIGYAKLIYWKKRLAGLAEEPGFVPVRIFESQPKAIESPAEVVSIWLANGISLEVPTTVAESDLARMVRVLGSC